MCRNNKLKIISEISWDEVLRLVNIGENCTGRSNTDDYNTGDGNSGNYTSGYFCTEDSKFRVFDKETNWTFDDRYASNNYWTMLSCPQNTKIIEWVREEEVSEKEKKDNPTYKTTGGYLKVRKSCKDRQKWLNNPRQSEKQAVYELPNFTRKSFL